MSDAFNGAYDRGRPTFFTSDTHFHHGNVIRYCDRPWAVKERGHREYHRPSSLLGKPVSEVPYEELKATVEVDVEAMNREMIRRWNEVVTPFDRVYHLGDFCMGRKQDIAPILKKLNGKKILIRGNHDRSAAHMREAGFDEVYESLSVEIDGVLTYMHHQPQVAKHWGGAQVHLCGHVHEKWKRYGDMINVGVDQWDFRPRTIHELLKADRQGSWPTKEQMQ